MNTLLHKKLQTTIKLSDPIGDMSTSTKQDPNSNMFDVGFAESMGDILTEHGGSDIRCVLSVPLSQAVYRHLLLWAEINRPIKNSVFVASTNQKIEVITATTKTAELFLSWFPNYMARYEDGGWMDQIIPIQREGMISGYAIKVTGDDDIKYESSIDSYRSKNMIIADSAFYGRHVSSLGIGIDEEYKLWKFLVENCSGAVKQMGTYLIFEKEEDALLFKMQK
jgi:hypothetical protein